MIGNFEEKVETQSEDQPEDQGNTIIDAETSDNPPVTDSSAALVIQQTDIGDKGEKKDVVLGEAEVTKVDKGKGIADPIIATPLVIGIPPQIPINLDGNVPKLGTNLFVGSAYHPQTDGQTEDTNHVLGNLLRCLTKEYGQICDQVLPQAEFSYNDSVNRTTGKSPFEIVYGLHPCSVCELRDLRILEGKSGHAEDFTQSMKEVHEKVQKTLIDAMQRIKAKEDERRKDIQFAVGDMVMFKGPVAVPDGPNQEGETTLSDIPVPPISKPQAEQILDSRVQKQMRRGVYMEHLI
ncbi:uncharacterized protein LOC131860352 [Cryptomeria japonica]|uniref:uncharacterized protein LOC131860352 n=1 Tax=Cryptomeria japonica TaxID=3369 RepID=UPI0027DAAE49|nr:uncharacterized protein LOC131860352 [Cryptomeria japonica]